MNKLKSIVTTLSLALLATSFLFMTNNASADTYGIRGGFDTDSDQLLIGFQSELGKLLEIARFAPSIDLGFGNDFTTIAFNGDFRISMRPPDAGAVLYGGAGLTYFVAGAQGGGSDSEFGVTLSGGVKFGAGKARLYNVEARLGLDQMPDLRLFFGIFF